MAAAWLGAIAGARLSHSRALSAIIVVVMVTWRKERGRTEALHGVEESAGPALEPKADIAAMENVRHT